MYVHMSDLMDEPAAITTTVTPTGVAGIDAVDVVRRTNRREKRMNQSSAEGRFSPPECG